VIVTSAQFQGLAREADKLVVEADAHQFVEDLLAATDKRPGRNRDLSVKALFVALQVMATQGEYFLRELPHVVNAFSPAMKKPGCSAQRRVRHHGSSGVPLDGSYRRTAPS
jgi:hypothetical protein